MPARRIDPYKKMIPLDDPSENEWSVGGLKKIASRTLKGAVRETCPLCSRTVTAKISSLGDFDFDETPATSGLLVVVEISEEREHHTHSRFFELSPGGCDPLEVFSGFGDSKRVSGYVCGDCLRVVADRSRLITAPTPTWGDWDGTVLRESVWEHINLEDDNDPPQLSVIRSRAR